MMTRPTQKTEAATSLFHLIHSAVSCLHLRHLLVLLTMYMFFTSGSWAGFEAGETAYKEKDYATALQALRPLAAQGHAAAQFYLGKMYANGEGITKDYVEAVKWFRKAAEQGNAPAQNGLGVMYTHGFGVAKDDVTACFWFSLAAAQGDEAASSNREALAKQMTTTQIAEAQDKVRQWKPVKNKPLP